MNKIFAFAIGNIWRWGHKNNRAKLLNPIRKLDISGVEITLANKKELYDFKLTSSQIKWLRSLDYVSIHAPFKLVRKAGNKEEVVKQLDYIQRLYRKINARNVIIHSTDLPSPALLSRYKMKFSTENHPKITHLGVKKLMPILRRYKNLGLCLDVAHAYDWSGFETSNLVNIFGNRIAQVHLSGNYRKKPHQSMRKVSHSFIKSIQPIKELNVPIVIEEDIKIKSIKYVKDEIKHIKSLFPVQ